MEQESYLEVWITAKPFTNTALKMAGMNIHQRNVFLSLCKMFLEGFGENWDRKTFLTDYKEKKQTSMKFWGKREWLEKQKEKIENEAFKTAMDDKYKNVRNKMRRLMPKKYRRDDAELVKFSKYEQFLSGIAYFNITLHIDIYDETPLQPTN